LPNVVWQVEEEVEAYADIPKTEVEVVTVARKSGLGHITGPELIDGLISLVEWSWRTGSNNGLIKSWRANWPTMIWAVVC